MSPNNDDGSYDIKSAHRRTESVQQAGVKNILISVCVAVTTFYSLALVANFFGSSLGSDAYFYLASLANLTSGVFGSLLGVVFLPAFVKLLNQLDKSDAYRFLSSIFSWCLVITLLASIPVFIWSEQFFLYASQFGSSKIVEMSFVLEYFAPIFFLGVLSELFRIVALSIGKFTAAAFSAVFPPFFLIVFLFSFGHTLHEEALAASLLLARVAALIMLVIVVWKEGVRVRFNLYNNIHTFRFLKTSTPYWSANIVTVAANFYFDYQASSFGIGVVTALAYANRIFMLPITIFIAPLVEIARTKFAEMHAAGDYQAFNAYYNNLLLLAIYFTIPVAALYFVFSHEIISALFQRGAFQTESVDIAASILSIYTWSIPFASVFLANGRACESYQRLLWPSIFGTLGNLLMIAAIYYLTKKFDYLGIPMAKVVIDIFYFLPFGFVAFQLFGGLPQYKKIITSFFAALASAILAAIFCYNAFLNGRSGSPTSIVSLIIHISAFLFLYCAALLIIASHVRSELKNLWYHWGPTSRR